MIPPMENHFRPYLSVGRLIAVEAIQVGDDAWHRRDSYRLVQNAEIMPSMTPAMVRTT